MIWDTKDIEAEELEENDALDIFVRAYFDSKNALESDCHYRCWNGKASFNYRLKFKE